MKYLFKKTLEDDRVVIFNKDNKISIQIYLIVSYYL